MKTWLIVGASRGIGAEICRQLLAQHDTRVYGTVRQPASFDAGEAWGATAPQRESGRCRVMHCDVAGEDSVDSFINQLSQISGLAIDYVVINAGILKYPNRATQLSYGDFALHLHTNTIGPIIVAQKLLNSKIHVGTIAFMSSDSGSAQRFREMEDGFGAYASSKAALNMMLRHMAAELKRKHEETIILAIHPGEVSTDMADIEVSWEVEGQMTPEESVKAMIPVINSKTLQDSGSFWTWKNEQYPW